MLKAFALKQGLVTCPVDSRNGRLTNRISRHNRANFRTKRILASVSSVGDWMRLGIHQYSLPMAFGLVGIAALLPPILKVQARRGVERAARSRGPLIIYYIVCWLVFGIGVYETAKVTKKLEFRVENAIDFASIK